MSMKALLAETAADHAIHVRDILSLSRARPIAHARQDFMWRARQVRWQDGGYRYSLPQVARFLGLKDHTSVLHGVRAHGKRMEAAATCPHGEGGSSTSKSLVEWFSTPNEATGGGSVAA